MVDFFNLISVRNLREFQLSWTLIMKKIIIVSFVFILVGGMGLGALFIKTRLPQYEGNLQLRGLSDQVSVTRDQWGVPHIEAENEEDLHRALGFVMAGDRLFQMDLLRRIVNGQLSEVFGSSTLEFDILLRKLRLRSHMDEIWEKKRLSFDPKMIKLMEAFIAGIHSYMETQPLPLEFSILGYRPRPFAPQEAMGISGYLALSFAEALITDPLYSDLKNELPQEVIDLMWIREKNDKNSINLKNKTSFNIKSPWYQNVLKAHDFFRDYMSLFHGSNSWVLAPSKTLSGSPILANDPHVAFSSPGIWYEAHLKSPEFEIYGHYIPLVPFPAMGHDRNRGWAVTMSEMDDLDLYEEMINDKNEVMFKNNWVQLKKYEETIEVRGDEDKVIQVYVTPHGPLIDDTNYGVEGKHIAVKWSYHHPDNDIATGFYKLSRTTKLSELNEALSYAATPGLNISWVDKEGNIAWKVMGKIPYRKGFRGNQILRGDNGLFEYERYFTIDENPGLINPKRGYIVSTNYRPEYKGELPIDGYWQPSERFERITQLLDRQDKWTLKELMTIQFDQFVGTGHWMRDILISSVKIDTLKDKEILNKFKNWSGNSHKESFGSSVYHMWIYYISKFALEDELGEERYTAYHKVADSWNFLKSFLKEENFILWDDVSTESIKETRAQIIEKAYYRAIKRLEEKLGADHSKWQWGNLHTVEYAHPLGKVKPLNYIFNLGPYEAGGGHFQVDNMSTSRYEDSFDVKLGPSVRRLIDFKKPETSMGILPTGNVGHINSPYYQDQVELFLNGQYREQWMDLKDVKAHDHQILKLSPTGYSDKETL